MDVQVTLKNYRGFVDEKPATISMARGMTALVGPNNAGKSSFLKFFHEFRDLFRKLSHPLQFQSSLQGGRSFFNTASLYELPEVFNNGNVRDMTVQLGVATQNLEGVPENVSISNRLTISIPRPNNSYTVTFESAETGEQEPNNSIQVDDDGTIRRGVTRPIFVGHWLAQLSLLADTVYMPAFRNAINVGTNEEYYDLRIGQAFITWWREQQSGPMASQNEAIYHLTRDIKHIFEFSDLVIEATPNNDTLQLMVDGKSYKLREVGSGIAQFILVLGNAAFRKPAYILIDEPELNLHPSLQLDFLTTLGSYASQGTIFSTHSIGLARAAGDRIYTLQVDEAGRRIVTPYEDTPGLSELLGEMSFSGYRELGSDRILLVEGKTDVKTMQQFLRHYNKDHKIVALSLAGADLINDNSESELQEFKRLAKHVSAVIDSEKQSVGQPLDPARQAFLETCQRVGIPCHVLDWRATENYLNDRAVKKVLGEKYDGLQPYADRNPQMGWAKAENWRIAREMTKEEIDETDLGEFLRDL